MAQADTVVPSGVQGYDRFAYANNDPVKYIDPTGHDAWWCETAACEAKYNRGNDKMIYLGGFKGGYQGQSFGQIAEDNWTGSIGTTGPVSGAAPQVPILPIQNSPPNIDNPLPVRLGDGISVADDQMSARTPPNADIFPYLRYTTTNNSISINSMYTYNDSDSTVYVAEVDFVAKNNQGIITQLYSYSDDRPGASLHQPNSGWLLRITKNTTGITSLYGTNANPTNTFTNQNASTVNITVIFVDPNATNNSVVIRNISLPIQ